MGKWMICMVMLGMIVSACDSGGPGHTDRPPAIELPPDSNQVLLEFSFQLNRKIYQLTNFGAPPQLAIWLESPDSSEVVVVWVSRRAAENDWKGKIECPVALPFWESRMRRNHKHFNTLSGRGSLVAAVSGATPREGPVTAGVAVPRGSVWHYYVEVNAAADYNRAFPYWSKDGLPDSQANGQPSLVYGGRITADGGSRHEPRIIGRSEQLHAVDTLSADVSGVTTANQLLANIAVQSRDR